MKRGLLTLAFLFVISGCSNEVDDKESLLEADTRSIYETNVEPREVHIQTQDALFRAHHDRFCWNEDLEVCKKMELRHPKDSAIENNTTIYMGKALLGERVIISYDSSDYNDKPKANHFELLYYQEDELVPIEVKDGTFVVQDIKGPQYYVYKATTDNEYKGIAYYPFILNVRDN